MSGDLSSVVGGGGRWAISGRVVPVDGTEKDARVVVVEGDRIVEVGDDRLLNDLQAGNVPIHDVGDGVVLPGFVDAHAHVETTARAHMETVDCRVPRCATVEEVLQTLSDGISRARDGWLVGQGNLFYDQKLVDKRLPTREELDSVSTDVSIVIRAGGHTSVLNSRAFETSDVVRYAGKTGMMGDAVIETDSTGAPTGVISELDKALPLPAPTPDELREELRVGIAELFTNLGVTSVGEISDSLDGLRTMDELLVAGETGTRTSIYLWTPGTLTFDDALEWQRFLELSSPEQWMRVRAIKMFADGGYSSRNAATRTAYVEPYAVTPGSKGQVSLSPEQIEDAARRAADAGLQLAVHANGERAQDSVCEGAVAAGTPHAGPLQVRVEHAGNYVTNPITVQHWSEAGIIPCPQPVFLYNFGDFFPVYLGPAGAKGRFPFRDLLDAGWRISGSSDIFIGGETEQTNPFFSMWCCVQRQTFFGEQIDPEQAVSIDEALEMHTINGAIALGEQDERGSIEKGKLADLVIVGRDPRELPGNDLRTLTVDATITGGRLVFNAGDTQPALGAR